MKYRVVVEELNYIGNVTERNIIGEFESRGWADPFAEMAKESMKEAINHRMVMVKVERMEEGSTCTK